MIIVGAILAAGAPQLDFGSMLGALCGVLLLGIVSNILVLSRIEPVLPGLTAQWNGKSQLEYWPGYALTRGSYSFGKMGQYVAFAGVEGEIEGNCHFCGEHTSIDSQGYLNGAVETGQRAANEVIAALR